MIDTLKKIATEARNATLEFLESHFDQAANIIKVGADGTPTSRIDLVAEDTVFELVKSQDLGLNILSEEYGFLNRGYNDTLVIDPLDGTYNAEHNIPYYSISLAIAEHDLLSVREGVVTNMISGKSYWAVKGKGSFFENTRLKIKAPNPKPLLVANLGPHASTTVLQAIKKTRRVRAMGCASLEMVMVATGAADLFIYDNYPHKILRIIDIAASTLIVKEAGGVVLEPDGKILNMNFDLKMRANVIAANPSYLETIQLLK